VQNVLYAESVLQVESILYEESVLQVENVARWFVSSYNILSTCNVDYTSAFYTSVSRECGCVSRECGCVSRECGCVWTTHP